MNIRQSYLIILLGTFIFVQIFFVTKIVSPGHFDQVTVYDLSEYNPKYEIFFNESLIPPNNQFIQDFGRSVSPDGLYVRVYEQSSNPEFPKLIWVQIDQNSPLNLNLDLKMLNLSQSYYQKLKNSGYYTILGNLTHFWVFSTDDLSKSVTNFRIEFFNLFDTQSFGFDLHLIYNQTLNSTMFQKIGYIFKGINIFGTFFYEDSIWLQEIYTANEKSVRFLSQYNPETLELINIRQLPDVFTELENHEIDTTILSISNKSFWVAFKEYNWNGDIISRIIPEDFFFEELPHKHLSITRDSIFYVIKNRRYFSYHSDLVGFYIIPKNEVIRSFPLIDFGIWLTFSGIGVIGSIIIVRRSFLLQEK